MKKKASFYKQQTFSYVLCLLFFEGLRTEKSELLIPTQQLTDTHFYSVNRVNPSSFWYSLLVVPLF